LITAFKERFPDFDDKNIIVIADSSWGDEDGRDFFPLIDDLDLALLLACFDRIGNCRWLVLAKQSPYPQ